MNERGKSDRPILPKKHANKGRGAPRPAERVEERDLTKGNSTKQNSHRAQDRARLNHALDGIRKVAVCDHEVRFTSLWHHVCDVDRLRETYFGLKRKAAAGVDDVTWSSYGEDLESNLRNLAAKLRRGAYRARPVARVFIPKPDGRMRPIGIVALEDKIVQRATTDVLNAIYENDFKGYSYGFRPERSAHDALNALCVGIEKKRVNWVLDADIRGFFDTIDHEWLMKFVEHRIADTRVLRHLKKWLKAGVVTDGVWSSSQEGTPQGGSISPLLANIYLHYALDLWVQHRRSKQMRGDVIFVRYADDFVVGFEHRDEAEEFLKDLRARLGEFQLELHPDKTRLIEFGRRAKRARKARGVGKPETFDFLGFTHVCATTRHGNFRVSRRTMRKRTTAKIAETRSLLRERMHAPIPRVGRWLGRVLEGHYQYFGVPGNYDAMQNFRYQILLRWRQVLRRRSQRGRKTWERISHLAERYLPRPRIVHPWPNLDRRV